jgi:translation elongation factor P/translation initiation factor 5A
MMLRFLACRVGVLRRSASVSIQGNDLKRGAWINLDGTVYEVVDFQHARSCKRGGLVQAEIRKLQGGSKITKRFRSKGERIEQVIADEVRNHQILEMTARTVTLMNTRTFDQRIVERSLLPGGNLVTVGMVVTVHVSGETVRCSIRVYVYVVCDAHNAVPWYI